MNATQARMNTVTARLAPSVALRYNEGMVVTDTLPEGAVLGADLATELYGHLGRKDALRSFRSRVSRRGMAPAGYVSESSGLLRAYYTVEQAEKLRQDARKLRYKH